MAVLSIMKDNGEDSPSSFESRFAAWRDSRPASKRWKFILPFRATLKDGVLPQTFKVLGERITWTHWPHGTRGIGKKRIDKMFSKSLIPAELREADSCLIIHGSGPTALSAADRADLILDTFRGMTELTIGAYSHKIIWPPKARRNIPHPCWCFAWNALDRELCPIIFIVDDFHFRDGQRHAQKSFLLTAKAVNQIRKNLESSVAKDSDPRSTNSLVADALGLYAQAMDCYRDDDCFLGLWQSAETLVVASERGGNDDVCARLSVLFRESGLESAGIGSVLRALAQRRNALVHRGVRGNITTDDANLFKFVIDHAFLSVLPRISELPTKDHLEHYLRRFDANEHSLGTDLQRLEAHRKALKLVERERLAKKK